MDRRNFLKTLVGGVAATAAVRSFPFRVFSFPTEIVAPPMLTRIDVLQGWAALKPECAVRVHYSADNVLPMWNAIDVNGKVTPLSISSFRSWEASPKQVRQIVGPQIAALFDAT